VKNVTTTILGTRYAKTNRTRDSDYDCRMSHRCLPTSRKRLVVPLRKWERPRQQAMGMTRKNGFPQKPDLPMPTVALWIQSRRRAKSCGLKLDWSGAKPAAACSWDRRLTTRCPDANLPEGANTRLPSSRLDRSRRPHNQDPATARTDRLGNHLRRWGFAHL